MPGGMTHKASDTKLLAQSFFHEASDKNASGTPVLKEGNCFPNMLCGSRVRTRHGGAKQTWASVLEFPGNSGPGEWSSSACRQERQGPCLPRSRPGMTSWLAGSLE